MLRGLNEELALPILQRRKMPDQPEVILPHVADLRVCITGAGGSVGSELVLQVAAHQMEGRGSLILIDNSELNLYEINQTLAECAPDLQVHSYIADVRSHDAIGAIFTHHRPNTVYHAAALKHVPMLENDHNLMEAVLTNVGGTKNVAFWSRNVEADMILISTDKAVAPSSVMGLTKRVAELTMISNIGTNNDMHIVRFGNVLGSSGSVVPLFRRQIAQGGPVTVTHEAMTRYMMTIRQAAELVVRAAGIEHSTQGLGASLTSPDLGLYVLDMGDPIRIYDLAENMIKMSGLRPHKDIEIKITGIRPGEKLEEALFYPHELSRSTREGGIVVCRMTQADHPVGPSINRLLTCAQARDIKQTKATLVELVPEYTGADVWK